MKKTVFVLMAMFFISSMSFAQKASPAKTSEAGIVSVKYSAPSKKGRTIFGELVPFGKVWRTGANEATEITFSKDATFGGVAVKAGTYSLFTIPTADSWTVILNPELKQWGSYGYDKIKDKDLEHFTVKTMKSDAVEQFNITTTADAVTIAWDMTKVSIPVK